MLVVVMMKIYISPAGVLEKRALKSGWATLSWTKFLSSVAVRMTMRMTVMKKRTSRA